LQKKKKKKEEEDKEDGSKCDDHEIEITSGLIETKSHSIKGAERV
jgi:hypothetical protein